MVQDFNAAIDPDHTKFIGLGRRFREVLGHRRGRPSGSRFLRLILEIVDVLQGLAKLFGTNQ